MANAVQKFVSAPQAATRALALFRHHAMLAVRRAVLQSSEAAVQKGPVRSMHTTVPLYRGGGLEVIPTQHDKAKFREAAASTMVDSPGSTPSVPTYQFPKLTDKADSFPHFGGLLTPNPSHMVAFALQAGSASASPLEGQSGLVVPYGPVATSVLADHYGQNLFDGLSGQIRDGKLVITNLDAHLARMRSGMARLSIPVPPNFELIMKTNIALLAAASPEISGAQEGQSIYVRPHVKAATPQMGVAAAEGYLVTVTLTPCLNYFSQGITLFVPDPTRVARAPSEVRDNPGLVKKGGNYSPTIRDTSEAKRSYPDLNLAGSVYCDQTQGGPKISETYASGLLFYRQAPDGVIEAVSPRSSGALPSITKASIKDLLERGLVPGVRFVEEDVPLASVQSGQFEGVHAVGTASSATRVDRFAVENTADPGQAPQVLTFTPSDQIKDAMTRVSQRIAEFRSGELHSLAAEAGQKLEEKAGQHVTLGSGGLSLTFIKVR